MTSLWITMLKVVSCKMNEEVNYVSVFHHHVTLHMVRIWLHNRPAKLPWNWNKITEPLMSSLECSLVWRICHELLWFYQNIILFHIIFVVTPGEIFGHLVIYRLTVNKVALPIEVSAMMVSYAFYYLISLQKMAMKSETITFQNTF